MRGRFCFLGCYFSDTVSGRVSEKSNALSNESGVETDGMPILFLAELSEAWRKDRDLLSDIEKAASALFRFFLHL